jgi:hypothetical protein
LLAAAVVVDLVVDSSQNVAVAAVCQCFVGTDQTLFKFILVIRYYEGKNIFMFNNKQLSLSFYI